MSHAKRNVSAAALLVGISLTFLFGMRVRDRADLGTPPVTGLRVASEGLLASREPAVDISDARYIASIINMLDRTYVEPVGDEEILGIGAVRGMVQSLDDPDSMFYDAEAFARLVASRAGIYHGIGAEIRFELPPANGNGNGESRLPVPRVVIASIIPGGGAEEVGLRPGDVIDEIEGKWLIDATEILRVRDLQRRSADPTLSEAEREAAAREFSETRRRLTERVESSILPLRARDRLITGTSGRINVAWQRGDRTLRAAIPLREVRVAPVTRSGDTVRMYFIDGLGAALARENLDGTTIDLRNTAGGDFEALREALAAVAPTGTYGAMVNERDETPSPISVQNGVSDPPRLALKVDETTTGVARMFAQALASAGHVVILGELNDQREPVIELVPLPDGSGYTLVRGWFTVGGDR